MSGSPNATRIPDVIVIGGGIAGIQAALDIAGHGIPVHLIEREPSIGGHMAQLDKTFPTNDCSMCILSPKMAEVGRHPLVTIHTCTEVEEVKGRAGDFLVKVRKYPRYVIEKDCTGCGDCIEVCPVEVYNRFDAGIGVRKAIYKPHAQAIPDVVVKDEEHCIECGLCYDACGPEAIRKEDQESTIEIAASAIVIATGYRVFDASEREQFGYLRLPDVITSLEFERMLSASGPTLGELRRLSDGREPVSIVFIQCVGSRDPARGRNFCSAVCCMSAMKNALLVREKHPEIEVTICYMDIRAYGKGYEEYYERAKSVGVKFVRGMPADVMEEAGTVTMKVEDTETGEILALHPDLVVLSVGLEPAEGTVELAGKFGITCEDSGFLRPADEKLGTVLTCRPGIYLAGTVVSPRDIPDCVAHGGAAAMKAFLDSIRECADE